MDDKDKIKNVLFLAISVGIIVPIWGTFHLMVGVKTGWAAFASAALFFAAGHKLKDSINVAIGHAIGVGWGIALFTLMSKTEFQNIDTRLVSLGVLCFLGIAAVIVTHMGVNLLSHIPSLFCGWAVTVGVLGGIPIKDWGNTPLDILLSLIAGVFFIGVGVSQLHDLFMKVFIRKETKTEGTKTEEKVTEEKVKDKVGLTESKMQKYVSSYKSQNDGSTEDANSSTNDFLEIKKELVNLKNSLVNYSSASTGGGGGNFEKASVKIVGICGSPHKKGSTVEYIKRALEAAESMGNVTTELIELAGKEIKPCMGCKTDKCYDKCKINDAMQEFYPILKDCDGIIMGSPSYFGTFSGQLKIFIDRLRVMRHTDFQLGNKVVAPLAVAGRRHGGQEITNLDLVQSMMRHNTVIVNDGTAVCQLGATGWSHTFDDPGSKSDDDEYGMQTAEGVGKRVAEIAKVIKASGLQRTVYKYNAKIGKR